MSKGSNVAGAAALAKQFLHPAQTHRKTRGDLGLRALPGLGIYGGHYPLAQVQRIACWHKPPTTNPGKPLQATRKCFKGGCVHASGAHQDKLEETKAVNIVSIREDAVRRLYPLRELFDAVRWMAKAGCPLAAVAQRTCRLGQRCTSRPDAGARSAALKP